ncbi:outer membrane protein assembly factor BamE [Comamonas suwonensis]|uniref:outer membrane protein assembly factor BamE n=1 Tax=Comamonas suwonensis TaxID=2606214 RepID=UPI00145DD361|nr:outer membrane protein assembly factor BamE [Comamonas suwonensis]MBI1625256.1 outer membrane protein assembly factor BamE [Comamonas suwonensis]
MKLFSRVTAALAAAAISTLALVGCDEQKIKELEEGLSTEADVRAQFGEPERVWSEEDGSRTFEYNRQPAGAKNYMITIGTDGKMSALRQVLAPHVFAKIVPGMDENEVRRMLGKPAKMMTFKLKQETDWDWNYIDPPNREMQFTVTFGPDGRVLRTLSRERLPDEPRG